MRNFAAAAMVIGIVVLGVACGGSDGPNCSANPAAPGCPPPVVTFTSSTGHLKVHDAYTFSATAAHSDGTSAAVTQWSSNNTSVATVEATSGKVTAVSQGQATIIAEHDGDEQTGRCTSFPCSTERGREPTW